MTKRRTFGGIGSFFDTVASAIAVSSAVREHRSPRASDLAQLGIDPARFRQINRF